MVTKFILPDREKGVEDAAVRNNDMTPGIDSPTPGSNEA